MYETRFKGIVFCKNNSLMVQVASATAGGEWEAQGAAGLDNLDDIKL